MTGPIFFIVMMVVVVTLPSIVGWKLSKKYQQFGRMAATALAGQLIMTPVILWLAYSEDRNFGENPLKAVTIYAAMALMISIMTFVILEIKNTRKGK
ncbi:MAG: hypothetical protein ABJP02_13430 [Parasphingorhabdus sp.]|uniref:hypothetical protein n=1 Tax=Parasphingorhabdus sp. TaxID=2709688 RepID=UPI003296E611